VKTGCTFGCYAQRRRSEQFREFLHADPRLADDGPQGAQMKFLVMWHDQLTKGLVSPQKNVAGILLLDDEDN